VKGNLLWQFVSQVVQDTNLCVWGVEYLYSLNTQWRVLGDNAPTLSGGTILKQRRVTTDIWVTKARFNAAEAW
jgi:hypothetical protein